MSQLWLEMRASRGLCCALIGLAFASATSAVAGPEAAALATLRATTNYLASLERFSVDGQAALEVVLTSGQKLQFDSSVALTVERPNKLRATRKGEVADQMFYYDGSQLTLFNADSNVYAVESVPGTLDGALDFARDELDIVAPAADLIYADAYAELVADVESGFVVSERALLDGVSCTHLAFRKPGMDIQIWVRNGSEPLPLKYVLTTTDMLANPQFVVTLSGWDTKPRIEANHFRFKPPPGAKKIEFLRTAPAVSPQ
jgi:hypothetical protein